MNTLENVTRRSFLATSTLALSGCVTDAAAKQAVKRGTPLSLEPLPFKPDALAPVISEQTLSFHYGKHHRGYVNTLNRLLPGTPFEHAVLEEIIRGTAGNSRYTALFNNAAQIWTHTFYWHSLSPVSVPTAPSKSLAEAITASFGSLEACKRELAKAATTQFGSGWAWLVASGKKLRVIKTANAETPITQFAALSSRLLT